MTVRELYGQCAELLAQSGNEDGEFDTMCIFQDILGDKHPLFRPQEEVSQEREKAILGLVKRRSEGYPLQYLLGEWEFYGYPFKVGEGVLIPRPETELLVENAVRICRESGIISPKIADLCSGSGCIAITLKKELPQAEVWALELDRTALGYLRQNAELNGVSINIVWDTVFSAGGLNSELDIIVCNPPYVTAEEMSVLQTEVRYEPAMALYGGRDGLDFYHIVTQTWKKRIRPGGWLLYEFGDGQHEAVGKILAGNGFENITFHRDLAGIVRTVSAQKQEDK